MVGVLGLDPDEQTREAGGEPDPPLRRRSPSELALRIAVHLAGAVVFPVAVVADLLHSWKPTGDDAVISLRAWQVLSTHPPLVGQYSQVSNLGVHNVYDPGPLLYWLLAVPVRLDPDHGVLWGSALLCMAGVALAVEAAWAFRGWPAALAVAAAVLVLVSTQDFVVINPVWNPSNGTVWFITLCAVALVVASGRLRWWPVQVLAASFVAQAHLEFAVTAVVLVVVAPVVGFLQSAPPTPGTPAPRPTRPRRRTWMAAGLGVGLLCWIAPLIQEVTGRPGNLTVLLGRIGPRPTYGIKFGFQALASVAGTHPLWASRQDQGRPVDSFLGLLGRITDHSELSGIVILAALALVVAGSWLLGRRDLAVASTVALVVSTVAVWTFSAVPQSEILTIVYTDIVLWPVGLFVWLVWIWTAGEVLRTAVAALRRPRPSEGRTGPAAGAVRWVVVAGLVLSATAASVLAVDTVPRPHLGVLGGWTSVDLVDRATAAAERSAPRGPVTIIVQGSDADVDFAVLFGVIWQLERQGRDVSGNLTLWEILGPGQVPRVGETKLVLQLGTDGAVLVSRSRVT